MRHATHRPEHPAIALIVNPILQREVNRIALASALALVAERARARKVVAKLMEARRHHPIGGVEGLLDTIAMVHVNVDVEDAGVMPQEFEDAEDNVVDVAEARGFALLGVVQAARPIEGNVGLARVETSGATCGRRSEGEARGGRTKRRVEGEVGRVDMAQCKREDTVMDGEGEVETSRSAAARLSAREGAKPKARNALSDPPAEMLQNSNNPSNAGQSSPIRTVGVQQGQRAARSRRGAPAALPHHSNHPRRSQSSTA